MPSDTRTPRYEALDSDETRLPTGMERIGCDEHTSTYSYLDHTDGTYWEGEEGAEYGELHRRGHPRTSQTHSASTKETYVYFLPFVLIVLTVLGTLFWYLGGGEGVQVVNCEEGWERYGPARGDTCWSIAEETGASVERLVAGNQGLRCEELKVGWPICVPLVERV